MLVAGGAPRSCVVVNASTLVTIDALDAQGVIRGGLVVPGVRLMLKAVADAVPAYKIPPGSFAEFPTTTPDSLVTGALQAVCGAIEQVRASLRTDDAPVACYLAGGAAHEVAANLSGPLEVVDNLVLEGVLVLASGTG
jgi:type III pantothenate kinase